MSWDTGPSAEKPFPPVWRPVGLGSPVAMATGLATSGPLHLGAQDVFRMCSAGRDLSGEIHPAA